MVHCIEHGEWPETVQARDRLELAPEGGS
jgi:hypothetical protein